jgi:acetoin utilization deacetylase AcuC-like enzyme/GNAT superfamily N-acetyltransferase
MFRIRRVFDASTPANAGAVEQVQDILHRQFPALAPEEVSTLPDKLSNPLKYPFRSILFVAEDAEDRVRGFALLLYAADLSFCFLDFVSAAPGRTGGGVGSALYERVREEAVVLGARALLFECLPDDPALCRDPRILEQNAARLRFYERYGARPVWHTAYETPLRPGGDCPPYLVYDDLGQGTRLSRDEARRVARAILEGKYARLCPPEYVDRVVESFKEDPVALRPPRYVKAKPAEARVPVPRAGAIALAVNEGHSIHHVRERGYVESPVRISTILKEIERTGLFRRIPARHFSDKHIRAVHDGQFVDYVRRACALVQPGRSIYPYVFPIRNAARPPKDLPLRAGYYCIDTFTPLNRNAYLAAIGAVDCALTSAQALLEGYALAYALVRPPGHHAERRSFGGFCYFGSTAVAANYLSHYGKVAVLDVDYHHGNGTQDIFYQRNDVLTLSIHGHPHFAYPYFSGFAEERGAGLGEGYNVNVPLPEHVDGERYRAELSLVLKRILRFAPRFLVVALGLDTARGDPTGSWELGSRDFASNGRMIGRLGLPTLVVQEGGYNNRSLGANARSFFRGLWEGAQNARRREGEPVPEQREPHPAMEAAGPTGSAP